MTQRFIVVEKGVLPSTTLDCVELRDSEDGLRITLMDEQENQFLIEFEYYLAYRRLDEGDALKTLSKIKKSTEKSETLYLVEESDFVAWFHEQSFGIHEGQKLNHYAIVALNDFVEIISGGEPNIRSL